MLSKTAIWIIAIAGILGIAAVICVYSFNTRLSPAPAISTSPSSVANKSNNLPAPTGNVDDLAKEMTESMTSETNLFETDSESVSVEEDLKALDELGQSYDENEF